jgi:hypothetical protein
MGVVQKFVREIGDQVEDQKELWALKKSTRRTRNSSTAWKAYARKEQESCDNSYRLSNAGQDARGSPASIVSVSFLNSPNSET